MLNNRENLRIHRLLRPVRVSSVYDELYEHLLILNWHLQKSKQDILYGIIW